jgi:hypothetical protein
MSKGGFAVLNPFYKTGKMPPFDIQYSLFDIRYSLFRVSIIDQTGRHKIQSSTAGGWADT